MERTGDFRPIRDRISETVQDTTKVAIDHSLLGLIRNRIFTFAWYLNAKSTTCCCDINCKKIAAFYVFYFLTVQFAIVLLPCSLQVVNRVLYRM